MFYFFNIWLIYTGKQNLRYWLSLWHILSFKVKQFSNMSIPSSGLIAPCRIKKSRSTKALFGLNSSVAINSFTFWKRKQITKIETKILASTFFNFQHEIWNLEFQSGGLIPKPHENIILNKQQKSTTTNRVH